MMRKTIKYLIVAIILIMSFFIRAVVTEKGPTGYASAYEACRDMAMRTAGYDVWVYQNEAQEGTHTTVFFTDDINTLSCRATQIGTLWYADAGYSFRTMSAPVCPESGCPWKLDYHGVSP